MGTAKLKDEGLPCDGLASNTAGSRNIPSHVMLLKPEISPGLMGHLNKLVQ